MSATASIEFTIPGDPGANVTVTEATVGGRTALSFRVEVHDTDASTPDQVADLRALYFQVANEALLPGLSVIERTITVSV